MGDELKTGLEMQWRHLGMLAAALVAVVLLVSCCSCVGTAHLESEISALRSMAHQLEQSVVKLETSIGGGTGSTTGLIAIGGSAGGIILQGVATILAYMILVREPRKRLNKWLAKRREANS